MANLISDSSKKEMIVDRAPNPGDSLEYDMEKDAFVPRGKAADKVSYDNTESELTATNVQAAIDELAAAGGGGGAAVTETTTSPTFDFAGEKTLSFYRVGRMVTMTIPDFFAADGNNSNDFALDAIPAGYRPVDNVHFNVLGNNVDGTGFNRFVVLADGTIEIHNPLTSVFPDDTSYSVEATALTWVAAP